GVVSWNYFDVFGIRPVLGRSFAAGEDIPGAEPLILLSHRYWLTNFDADQSIVGTSLEMNNAVHKVIGVLPPMPAYPDDNDIYITSASCPFRSSEAMINNRRPGMLTVFAKLNENTTITQGTKDVNTIAGQLATQYPDDYRNGEGYSANLLNLKDEMVGDSANTFYLLLVIAGLVVLIASANVANLNMARLSSRSQELAIREALGANPRRLARQLLTESTLFALVGGVFGLLLAYPSLGLLTEFANGYTSLSSEIEMDASVLVFSLVLSLITGVASGSAVAFRRRNINVALKEGGDKVTATASGKRLRHSLLVIQFALAFVVLTTSVLVTVSLYRLNNQDAGFDGDNVLTVGLDLNFTNYTNRDQVRDFASRLLADVKALAGVDVVSLSGSLPLASQLAGPISFQTEGQQLSSGALRPQARVTVVSENYHQLLNIPLLRGRLFASSDDENSVPVVLINQSMAQHFFSDSNPIDERISIDNGENWATIVGIVGDTRAAGLDSPEGDAFYAPFMQRPTGRIRLMVKTGTNARALNDAISEAISFIDPQQAIANVQTMNEIRAQWLASPRLVAILVGLFGLLALLITLSGVVGVVAYNVSLRVKEIGIRLAIGATPANILKMLLLQGSGATLLGLILGLACMVFVTPFIDGFLFETNPADPAIYTLCAATLLLVSLLAMSVPAAQATNFDPASALRDQ
ncbi:MAG: putative ABC transport system permease protein, partial [Oceanicoccus sp.]